MKRIFFKSGLCALLALGAAAAFADRSGYGQSNSMYATDAFPGFDPDPKETAPEKKEPKLFGWLLGPKMDNAADQFVWSQQLEAEESWSRAARAYDALVREWPTAPEAPKAQLALARIRLEEDHDYEEAYAEYRYMMDFYPLATDFSALGQKLYDIAELMREEGKRILFFRFANTVDVRRAYESAILRSPGAPFVPQALLTVASLREDEDKYDKAVEVYENLRNLYPETEEARTGLRREGAVRMTLVGAHGYNRGRLRDTQKFLRQALANEPDDVTKEEFLAYLGRVDDALEDEGWRAAKFYDSNTRTKRSAINAYRRFLAEFPSGPHAEEARERLARFEAEEAEREAEKAAKAEPASETTETEKPYGTASAETPCGKEEK